MWGKALLKPENINNQQQLPKGTRSSRASQDNDFHAVFATAKQDQVPPVNTPPGL